MRVADNIILATLAKGGCIKTFYRLPARTAQSSAVRIPDGFVLESAGEYGDTILSHTDFQALEKQLVQTETWEQVVGAMCFGGATWVLRPEATR
jgi:hypothetical protein